MPDDHDGATDRGAAGVAGRRYAPQDTGVLEAGATERPLEPLGKRGREFRCPLCMRPVGVTPRGRAGRHVDQRGDSCPGSGLVVRDNEVPHELPPVSIADRPVQPRGEVIPHADAAVEGAARLDVGSSCLTCGKWIPGERSYCGRCMAKRRV
jgi:hypothetical protein